MKKGKITMVIILGLMCMILTIVIFVQFRTISQTDINSMELMREDELKSEIALFKTKYDDTLKKIEETDLLIAEYEEIITSGKEASEVFNKELSESNGLVRKK